MFSFQRPLTDSFRLAYSFDPALDRERFEAEHPEPAEPGMPSRAEEEFNRVYQQACEQLDFAPITKPGQQLVLFVFKPLKVSQLRDLGDVAQPHRRPYLAFRMALQRVENAEELGKIEHAIDGRWPELGPLVKTKTIDILDALPVQLGRHAGELVNDLGNIVIARTAAPSPK